MLSMNVCDKCGSADLRPSRIRNLPGWLISFMVVPYRCRICDYRQMKFRFVTVEDGHASARGPAADKPHAGKSAT